MSAPPPPYSDSDTAALDPDKYPPPADQPPYPADPSSYQQYHGPQYPQAQPVPAQPGNNYDVIYLVWLSGLVISALGIRTRGPRFDSRVVSVGLFHWAATLGKLFTHITSPAVSQLQETGVQKGVFGT